MRSKIVTIENAEYRISPLTVDQIDELFIKRDHEGLGPEEEIETVTYLTLSYGLNNPKMNALGEMPADAVLFDQKRIRLSMDYETMTRLSAEVRAYSGLVTAATPEQAGEDQPAQ